MSGGMVTYGQKYLLDLIEMRQLVAFCRRHVGDSFSAPYVLGVAHGTRAFPSIRFICRVSEAIPPAWWFYYVDERLPERKTGKVAWKRPVDYGRLLDAAPFCAWARQHRGEKLSLESFAARIAGGRSIDMPSMLDAASFARYLKKSGIKELSAHSFIAYIDDALSAASGTRHAFDYRKSENFRSLLSIGDLYGWCREHGQKYVTVSALIKGKRQLTPQRIMAMRHVLAPEKWFE